MCIRDRAEAEKEVEIDMENKEATPVDVERSLPPVLSKQPAQPEEQPEMPTQTGEVNVRKEQLEKSTRTEDGNIQEMIRAMMEQMDENRKKDSQSLSNKMEKMDENRKEDNQSLNKKLEE